MSHLPHCVPMRDRPVLHASLKKINISLPYHKYQPAVQQHIQIHLSKCLYCTVPHSFICIIKLHIIEIKCHFYTKLQLNFHTHTHTPTHIVFYIT